MKINNSLNRTVNGVRYDKLSIAIPKQVERSAGLEAGTMMFLSVKSHRKLLLLAERRYNSDVPVTLVKNVHKKTLGKRYYRLKVSIRKRIAMIAGIEDCKDYDVYHSGKNIIIEFY